MFSLTFSDESAIKEVSLGAQEKKINHAKCELSHAKMFLFFFFLSASLLPGLTMLKVVFSKSTSELLVVNLFFISHAICYPD